MQGVNKKLLWATIILAALLIGILSFLAGSYFGQKNNSVIPNNGSNTAPAPSGNSSGAAQSEGRSPKDILLGQMFWMDPNWTVGLAVSSDKDIRLLMNDEIYLLDQLIFFDPTQIDGDWMNCSLEMHSMNDDTVINVGLYVTESDDLGAYINTFCGDVRTTMYPSSKNPFAKYGA
ncbi:MAG: hypothetical protein IKG47_06145 [Oscillospiraceae bacterium]|nr:hypothetical protein [Oscillospiraceae bacterium]